MAEQYQNNANRYQFYGLIGKGRMADVYRCMDNFFRVELAFKTLHPETTAPEFLNWFNNRFPQDAAILSKLGNPNIIRLYDTTSYNGVPSWTMDLYSGAGYHQYCGQAIPFSQAAGMLIPVADALAYAHQMGVVHGNLKPSNILIDGNNQPILTDFALTRWLSENGHGYGSFEAAGGIGSPEYLAPEQAQGLPVDPRTDIYSLGIIFYELVTGRRPFSAVSPLETMKRQVSDQLPSPRYFAPNISQNAEQLMYQATAKNPMSRISSMGEFALMLRNLASDPSMGAYFPPASYYSQSADDDDDEVDESFFSIALTKVTEFFGSLRTNRRNLFITIGAALFLLLFIIILSVSGSNRKAAAFRATATQEAIHVEETTDALRKEMEEKAKATETFMAEQNASATKAAQLATQSAELLAPTATSAFQIPSAIEVPTTIPTASVTGSGRFQSQTPTDGQNFIMGQAFDVVWTLENTGNAKWDLSHKLIFNSGVNFATGNITETYISQEVWPRGAAGLVLHCTAPSMVGSYSMQWYLADGNGNTIFTPLVISINVVEGELTPTPQPTEAAAPVRPTSETVIEDGIIIDTDLNDADSIPYEN